MDQDAFEDSSDFVNADDPILELEVSSPTGLVQTMDYLNNVDYSLNSPLIDDEVRNLIKFLKGQIIEKRWNEIRWREISVSLSNRRLEKTRLLQTNTHHAWFARRSLAEGVNLRAIRVLMKKTIDDAQETYGVPDAYLALKQIENAS